MLYRVREGHRCTGVVQGEGRPPLTPERSQEEKLKRPTSSKLE